MRDLKASFNLESYNTDFLNNYKKHGKYKLRTKGPNRDLRQDVLTEGPKKKVMDKRSWTEGPRQEVLTEGSNRVPKQKVVDRRS